MLSDEMQTYIASLPIGNFQATPQLQDDEISNSPNIDHLPNIVVIGSSLVEFPDDVDSVIKSSVALSLLAAQRVAQEDVVVNTPQQWINRQTTVLENLSWKVGDGATVNSQFSNIDKGVNQAIIPFLTSAFSGGGQLIISTLNQLKDASKNAPWFALFDRQSQRFQVTEYQFSAVSLMGDQVNLKLASARFDATFGRTQVLFFHVTHESGSFQGVSRNLSTNAAGLADMNDSLKAKLAGFSTGFIRSLSF
jgi:hypothetical protein